ncbi:MAG TPA: hypothetical protein PLX65_09215, partial [Accumulibacter sp.]|nr:hypothetical protein [Accumulibacter sp.]
MPADRLVIRPLAVLTEHCCFDDGGGDSDDDASARRTQSFPQVFFGILERRAKVTQVRMARYPALIGCTPDRVRRKVVLPAP